VNESLFCFACVCAFCFTYSTVFISTQEFSHLNPSDSLPHPTRWRVRKLVQICIVRMLPGSPTSTVNMPHTMALIKLEQFQVHGSCLQLLLPRRCSLLLGQEQRSGFLAELPALEHPPAWSKLCNPSPVVTLLRRFLPLSEDTLPLFIIPVHPACQLVYYMLCPLLQSITTWA